MDSVVHFELPAGDSARSADFYSKVFGWKTILLGPEMGNYTLAQTGPTDEKGMPEKSGCINGGIFQKTKPEQGVSVVISVEDLQASIQKIKDAGGTILGGGNPNKKSPEEPDDIPGIGLYVAFVDTEGNRMGMLQPAPGMR